MCPLRFTAYQHLVLLGAPFWNLFAFDGSRIINAHFHHYQMAQPIDDWFPFLPWTILIYFGCFVFWAVNYIYASTQDRDSSDRFFCADVLTKWLCLIIFVAVPTTMVRPEPTGTDIFSVGIRLLYSIDPPTSLFPSIHCLNSWLCWIVVRKNKRVPLAYKWFSFLFAIAVCVSTLTTRQHVFMDTFTGILAAELCWYLAGFGRIRSVFTRSTDAILSLFKKK